jgi:hypothetical protein
MTIQVPEVNHEQTELAGATEIWFRVSRKGTVCQKGSLRSSGFERRQT